MMIRLLPALKGIIGLTPARTNDTVAEDARSLIAALGSGAYEVARTRGREERLAKLVDKNRPIGHWHKVRREIARRTGKVIGADSASGYPDV